MLTIEKVKGSFVGSTRKLYHSSFAEWERIPFWSLRLRSLKKDMDLFAFCDDGAFCGFASLTVNDKAAYIQYFAVEKSLRGKGIGGEALKLLAEHYDELPLALDIPAVLPGTEGAKQRARFKKFYLRNGFKESSFGYKDGGVVYEIFTRGEKREKEDYAKLINMLAFGLTKIRVRKVDELK
ncbi:GNAT family N-acetyltransferase [uncultured Slackia sp.]|uniref:GNAT family N-acetyltransferase n=1 Tax=uncultured Slackia sp. TaxID=665903 RepID=UPI0025EE5EF8|nr:GNAT family N-acetyltransferase [uncultured Slackia sp.]